MFNSNFVKIIFINSKYLLEKIILKFYPVDDKNISNIINFLFYSFFNLIM